MFGVWNQLNRDPDERIKDYLAEGFDEWKARNDRAYTQQTKTGFPKEAYTAAARRKRRSTAADTPALG